MKDLIGYVNAGFEIVQQGVEAVIGLRESDGEYVAWHYNFRDDEPNFFWGRYGTKDYAEKCFWKKENGIYSGD